MILPQGISGARTTSSQSSLIHDTRILPQGISGARTTAVRHQSPMTRSQILPQGISGARTTWRSNAGVIRFGFYHRE